MNYGNIIRIYEYIFEWKKKQKLKQQENERNNYIQLQQIHISKMKDLPDRTKKKKLIQEYAKDKLI